VGGVTFPLFLYITDMILSKFVEVIVSTKTIKFYKDIYPDACVRKPLKVKISELTSGSHAIILAKCDKCGKEKNVRYCNYLINFNNGSYYSCSEKCSVDKMKATNLKNIGVEFTAQSDDCRQKYKDTMLDRYGIDHIFKDEGVRKKALNNSKSEESKNKRTHTLMNNYGVDNAAKSQIVLEKTKKTNLERYGVEFVSKNKDVMSKYKKSIFSNIKDKYPNLSFIEKDGYLNNILCDKCNEIYEINTELLRWRSANNHIVCTKCNNPLDNSKSEFEMDVINFIKSYNIDFIHGYKIGRYEIDIYIPELKIGFECNGVYWHSELYKDKNYHLDNTKLCLSNDIKLYHIWEDDWKYKGGIVKSMILNKIGLIDNKIGARKCKIEFIDSKRTREFLNNNHIQGYSSSKYNIGLIYDNELVSKMELVRFCNKLNYNIVGSANKLFKYFIKNHDISEIVSYADTSFFDGGVYDILGFDYVHTTKPNYWWVIGDVRKHRFGFRKSKIVKTEEDKTKTEKQIMNENGFYRIWGIGLKKFVFDWKRYLVKIIE
jgi:hypothetical protein